MRWDDNLMTVSLCCSNRLQLEADAKALEKELKEFQGIHHPTISALRSRVLLFTLQKIQVMFRLKLAMVILL